MKQNKNKLRFLYICPNKKCGAVILKTEKYIEGTAKIKCQKCAKIFELDKLLVRRI